jgi:hypothetical protein
LIGFFDALFFLAVCSNLEKLDLRFIDSRLPNSRALW